MIKSKRDLDNNPPTLLDVGQLDRVNEDFINLEPTQCLEIGLTAIQNNQFRRAEISLRQALQCDSPSLLAYSNLAYALNHFRQWSEALAFANCGLEREPENLVCLKQRAIALLGLDHDDEANATIEQLKPQLQHHGDFYLEVGLVLKHHEQPSPQARRCFERALQDQTSQSQEELTVEEIKQLIAKDEFPQAENMIFDRLEYSKNKAQTSLLLCQCFRAKQAYEDSKKEAVKAVRAFPDWDYAHFQLARSCFQNQAQEKEAAFLKAIDLNPYEAKYFGALSELLCLQQRNEEALSVVVRGLELDENDLFCLNTQFNILFHQNQSEDAIQVGQKLVKAHPQSVQGHYNLGMLLVRQYRQKEALQSLLKVNRLQPNYLGVRSLILQALKQDHTSVSRLRKKKDGRDRKVLLSQPWERRLLISFFLMPIIVRFLYTFLLQTNLGPWVWSIAIHLCVGIFFLIGKSMLILSKEISLWRNIEARRILTEAQIYWPYDKVAAVLGLIWVTTYLWLGLDPIRFSEALVMFVLLLFSGLLSLDILKPVKRLTYQGFLLFMAVCGYVGLGPPLPEIFVNSMSPLFWGVWISILLWRTMAQIRKYA